MTERSTSVQRLQGSVDPLANIKPDPLTNLQYPDLATIKSKIPEKYFRPVLWKSLSYAAIDAIFVSVSFYAFACLWQRYNAETISAPVFWSLWAVYAFVQGTNFWAVFVLGHDCGHGSFSRSHLLNDIIGNIYHSFIMTPYYPWKLSHRSHHKNTGSLDNDEIFYPVRKSDPNAYSLANGQRALYSMGAAWFAYLLFGFSPRWKFHFSIFNKLHLGFQTSVIISLSGMAAMAFGVYSTAQVFGWTCVILGYFVPLYVFGCWLVITTFLHHSDPGVPWFGGENWNYVKGNLSSIDREYGLFHWWTHNIGTHQVHHLFPIIPHYHLRAATKHFQEAFPTLVRLATPHKGVISSYWSNLKLYQKHGLIDDVDAFAYPMKEPVNGSHPKKS